MTSGRASNRPTYDPYDSLPSSDYYSYANIRKRAQDRKAAGGSQAHQVPLPEGLRKEVADFRMDPRESLKKRVQNRRVSKNW